nr:flavin reductase family protein [Nitratireductor luteus]
MAHFAGAVHVVTTDGPAGLRGVTAIAACSVSDDPPIVLVCLNRHNPNNDLFLQNGVFSLNTLSAGQEELSNAFSGLTGLPPEKRFALARWETLSSGAPCLKDAIAVFDCQVMDTKDLATHRIYFGKVTGLRVGANLKPLLYHNRGYRTL